MSSSFIHAVMADFGDPIEFFSILILLLDVQDSLTKTLPLIIHLPDMPEVPQVLEDVRGHLLDLNRAACILFKCATFFAQ